MSRIVVVEPPSPGRSRMEDALRDAGHDVVAVDDADAARPRLAEADVVVADDPRLSDAARLAGCIPVRPPATAPGASPAQELRDAVRRALEDVDFDEASLERMRDQFGLSFSNFLDLFLRESLQRATALQAAVGRRDAGAVGHEAHTLKPTSGMMGARRLASRCAEVEAVARQGWSDDLPDLCVGLLDDLARLRRRLEAPP